MNGMKATSIFASASILFLLSACGTSAPTDSAEKQPSDSNLAGKPADLIFVSASADSVESFDDRFGNALRKKFPNFNIQYVKGKIPELLAAGQPMDIVWDSIGKT